MELPFQQVVKINELQSNMNPEINIELGELEHRDVGGNQEQIRLNMNINVLNNQDKNITLLKNIEITDEDLPKMPSIVVYYVKAGDSLWSIAKKFNTTVASIKKTNKIAGNNIYAGRMLTINKNTK